MNHLIVFIGRFDMKASAFKCASCGFYREAEIEEYIVSGYWPGIVDPRGSYFISEEQLLTWYHLQHKSPGVSRNKYLETLESISAENNRVSNTYFLS